MADMWETQKSSLELAVEITGHWQGEDSSRCVTCEQKWVCETVEAAAQVIHDDRNNTISAVRGVVTQYLATAEKWRYDRVVWAFAVMLGEIPQDTPEPMSPADYEYLLMMNGPAAFAYSRERCATCEHRRKDHDGPGGTCARYDHDCSCKRFKPVLTE